MNVELLALLVVAVVLLSLVLRFMLQPRVRRVDPRTRYRLFGVLLGIGVGTQTVGAVVAAFSDRTGAEIGCFVTALLLAVACILEMRDILWYLARCVE